MNAEQEMPLAMDTLLALTWPEVIAAPVMTALWVMERIVLVS